MEKQHGKHLEDYFHQNRIKDVAIYGMSYIGKRLYDELKSSDIEVKYVVDKNAKDIGMDIKTFFPDEEFPEVDAIIVTAISFFDEIEEILLSKINYKVISIEDILYEK